MENEKIIYCAVVFDEEKRCFGKRISFEAGDIDDAVRIMNSEYGEGNYIDLHNKEAADKPR